MENTFENYIKLATLQIEQGNLQVALNTIEKALGENPNSATCYRLLNSTHLKIYSQSLDSTELEQALRYAQIACELDPLEAESHYCLATVYHLLEKYQLAEQNANHALELNPHDPDSHVLLGDINHEQYAYNEYSVWFPAFIYQYVRRKLYYQPLTHYQRALELEPNNLNALTSMTMYYYEAGDYQQAGQYAMEVLRLDPAYYLSHIVVGHLEYANKNYEQARQHALYALSQEPENYAALELLLLLDNCKQPLLGRFYRFILWLSKTRNQIIFYILLAPWMIGLSLMTQVNPQLLMLVVYVAIALLNHQFKRQLMSKVKQKNMNNTVSLRDF